MTLIQNDQEECNYTAHDGNSNPASPRGYYYSLPNGEQYVGWELTKSKMATKDIIFFFSSKVKALTEKFTEHGFLLPTVSDITIIKPLRLAKYPICQIEPCQYLEDKTLTTMSSCHLPKGMVLNPFAIITDYGIAAYACSNHGQGSTIAYQKSNIQLNPVIIPFEAIDHMYTTQSYCHEVRYKCPPVRVKHQDTVRPKINLYEKVSTHNVATEQRESIVHDTFQNEGKIRMLGW